MYIIVGLGNIGAEYEYTRHNIGWIALDYFIAVHGLPSPTASNKASGALSEGSVCGNDVVILYPHTYMNNSGSAVVKILPPDINLGQLIVVHDDIALPFGEVRVNRGRGSGGHNGVESIMLSLGSKEFVRVRIGIGMKNIFGILKRPHGEALSRFVLGAFKKKEETELEAVKKRVNLALMEILSHGVEKAMQAVNGRAIEV